MNMDKAEESLNNYFNKVKSLVETNREFRENKGDIEQLADILGEELKLSRENENRLRDEIKTLLDTCNSFSSLNFIDLKENVKKLQEENKKLLTEINDLKEVFNLERTHLKQLHEDKIQLLTAEQNEAIQKVTEEVKLVKEDSDKQKQQLYAEIQLLQAQAAMQCDSVETKYFSQISDLNNKLRQVNLFNTNLRSELQNMKAQYNILLNNKEQDIFELKNKLKNLENALLESRIQSSRPQQSGQNNLNSKMKEISLTDNDLENFCNIESEFQISNARTPSATPFTKSKNPYITAGLGAKSVGDKNKSKSDTNTKYSPLDVTRLLPKTDDDPVKVDDFEELEVNHFTLPTRKYKPTVYIGGSRGPNRRIGQSTSAILPPLKQCSNAKADATNTAPVPKKRKLYNPDDLDYLDKLDGPD